MLPPMVPLILNTLHSAKVSEERKNDLEKAHSELTHLYDRLKEFDQLKTQFFANVSHELRTPLALILGPVDKLLAQDNLSNTQHSDLTVMKRNAKLLLKHVNDLLDVSKLEAGKMSLHYVRFDLAHLVRVTASYFENLSRERKISFEIVAPETLTCEMDIDRIQRALLNLLSNAFKYAPNNGKIRCSLSLEKEAALLEVADSGPGIPMDMRTAIFERFRQMDGGSTRRFGGTGLGLSIVKDFVTIHRGSILVKDAPEGGACFLITFPIFAPEGVEVSLSPNETTPESLRVPIIQAVEELQAQVDENLNGQAEADKPMVLVVEDNSDMNRFLADSLRTQYRVETAHDGKEGLEKALEVNPDLILCDVMMPGMSGDQLISEFRKRPDMDTVPIVLLTAKADDDLRIRLLREGAQDYLTKPFSNEELLARIKNLITIRRAREVLQKEIEIQLGDLETLAREVTSRKRELENAKEALEIARDHAEKANLFKSSLLRMVSHEFRTPLTSLQLQLQILERDPSVNLPPVKKKFLNEFHLPQNV